MSNPPEPHDSGSRSPGWSIQDRCVNCFLLQVCECVIFKKNNNLATPRFPPVTLIFFDGKGRRAVWSLRPSQMDADTFFLDGVNEAGGRLDCPSLSPLNSPPPPPPLLPPPTSSPLPLIFCSPSDVPLHVQGQVVRPGETPTGRNKETVPEILMLHPKYAWNYIWKICMKWENIKTKLY